MSKQEFYNHVAKNYFEELEIHFRDFCRLYKMVAPIFGELKVERIDSNDEIELKFIDHDVASVVMGPLDVSELNKEDLDMSTISLLLILNKEGEIKLAEHGVSVFTPANKDLVLFLGSLIGKKLIF